MGVISNCTLWKRDAASGPEVGAAVFILFFISRSLFLLFGQQDSESYEQTYSQNAIQSWNVQAPIDGVLAMYVHLKANTARSAFATTAFEHKKTKQESFYHLSYSD